MAQRLLATLGRHQVGSLVATGVDFLTMIALVSLADVRPYVATACGAGVGGVTNFSLGRTWIFHAERQNGPPQAARYALTSAAALGLNSAGVFALHDLIGLQYVLARALVAVAVSLAWNFPMHRRFVFAHDSCAHDSCLDRRS